ncbi:MAG: ion transporter [Sulfurimonas sp.]
MQKRVQNFVELDSFKNFIIGLIILNGITMGFETSQELTLNYGGAFELFNNFVITVFTIEILLRTYAYRVAFFKDAWSIFDFIIVAISLVPASAGFGIFRILRVLRLFRLITVVPQMRKIVAALLGVIPGMLSIIGLMGLVFYIFAIMATNLYGEKFPQWFGDLGASFYTLFQVMTLESWSMGIVRPVMEVHPTAWLFFIPFIFITTFVMINLIVAVVVDAMAVLNQNETETIVEELHHTDEVVHYDMKELHRELKEIKALLKNQN